MAVQTGSYDFKAAKEAHDSAAQTSTKYITDFGDDGIKVHPDGDDSNYTAITSAGMDVYQDGSIVARFGWDGAQIGKSNAGHSVIDANGQRFYASNGTTQLANIGYGEGTSETGTTADAPYYLFGSTPVCEPYRTSYNYFRGDLCIHDGYHYCCKEDSVTGTWDSSKWQRLANTNIRGNLSVTEGYSSSRGHCSHSEGNRTIADGEAAHAEGYGGTRALGDGSHAEGFNTEAFGNYSHSEGRYSYAEGSSSHAQNLGTVALQSSQTAIGRFNVEDVDTVNPDGTIREHYAFIIGNGTDDANRSNAHTVDWQGNAVYAGDVTDGTGNVLAEKLDATDAASAYLPLTGGVIAGDLSVTGAQIVQGWAGVIQMFAGSTPPAGWLLCDGSAVSRTTYATLYAAIGDTWGAGDGSTTFNLPDLRGRAPIGAGTGSGLTARTLGGKVGAESVTLTAAQSGLRAHTHGFTQPTITPKYSGASGYLAAAAYKNNTAEHTYFYENTSGGRQYAASGGAVGAVTGGAQDATSAHNNMQPSAVVNFIIHTGKTD